MNKVLVTGLAIGTEVGFCQVCNFDFEWILRYPSVLLWADKILVTNTIWETASGGEWPPENPVLAKALKLIFNIAKVEGIVEVVNPNEVILPTLRDAISAEVDKDRALLAELFPERIKLGNDEEVPGQIFIDGAEYCSPHLKTIYATLALARAWNAHCLFNRSVYNYCMYKFGLSSFPKEGEPGITRGLQSVFEAYVPNTPILPEYVLLSRELCLECAKEQECKDKYLMELETNLKEMLTWRDYDELHQLKAVVEDIVQEQNKAGGAVSPSDILHDLRSREDRLRRRVKLVFPKVKRWANITMMLSIPIVVAGVASDLPLITVTGAGLVGLSQMASELIDLLSSKYGWIGFLNKETELHHEA